MSFMTYKETRPWAKAIKGAVLSQKMPPWFMNAAYGHFANERKLTNAEFAVLTTWADNGAAEGDAKDARPPVKFAEGWSIGTPDMVVAPSSDTTLGNSPLGSSPFNPRWK